MSKHSHDSRRLAPDFCGANGTILVLLDSETMRGHALDIEYLLSLSDDFGSIGLAICLAELPACGRRTGTGGRSRIVVVDPAGNERYRRRVAPNVAIDFADLIEHVGDVADGD